jgi:hypothetical protein
VAVGAAAYVSVAAAPDELFNVRLVPPKPVPGLLVVKVTVAALAAPLNTATTAPAIDRALLRRGLHRIS